ncbi:MAG: enoyl-CoA hydratase [Mycobacterium sp.]|jgi:enoyl-CoA hydratase|nr:enoyl-CoA hydratase [Mycobacterium sp.]
MADAGLDVVLSGGVLRMTLNRPDSLNSLNESVLVGVAEELETAATDPRVKVVRIGGVGRAFSSGGSISADELAATSTRPPEALLDAANRAVRAICALPRPVVAAVHGPAVGGGAALAFASDVVLASDAAYFMLSATRIGLMPDCGATALIAAAAGRIRAMRMALLSERISASEALQCGLVTAVYPAHRFDADVDAVLDLLAAGPAAAQGMTKDAVDASTLSGLEDALNREQRWQSLLLKSADFTEGASAFQQRRAPDFTDR